MALNKAILMKIDAMTKENPDIREFLVHLLTVEDEGRGNWKVKYNESLEKFCKEDEYVANFEY
jgi:hypothetical protein